MAADELPETDLDPSVGLIATSDQRATWMRQEGYAQGAYFKALLTAGVSSLTAEEMVANLAEKYWAAVFPAPSDAESEEETTAE